MSRIGKLPINIPTGVKITVDSDFISVEGPKGKLVVPYLSEINVSVDDGKIIVTRKNDEHIAKSQHGLERALLFNAVSGVVTEYSKKLEVNGVGFRISGGGKSIEMSLGFSHPVKYTAPDGINLEVNKMEITVSGIDKQLVGQVAADIRALKKPEPYKGKGIKYADEVILRKAGKTGK
jgi:large subunit ribosomal protein L6